MPNRKADTSNKYCIKVFKNFDNKSIKILTVYRGKEFAGYSYSEEALTVDVFSPDYYNSWQRGSNENINELIREFFPKKFDFSTITQENVLDIKLH